VVKRKRRARRLLESNKSKFKSLPPLNKRNSKSLKLMLAMSLKELSSLLLMLSSSQIFKMFMEKNYQELLLKLAML